MKINQIFYTIVIFVLTAMVNLFIILACKMLNLLIVQYILAATDVFLLTVLAWYNVKYFNLYKANIDDKTTELSKKVRRALMVFFEYSEIFEQYNKINLGITDIKTWETEYVIHIEITLERPGLLIGKAGTVLDACVDSLEKQLEKKIQIHIEESKLWQNLYK